MTVINQKQKIRTINAKALFKHFPKGKDDKAYTIYFINKSLCRHVIKQEEDMESCPVFDQFYREIEIRCGKDEKFEITGSTLLDKFVVMDFDNIFMPYSESASDSVKSHKESLQECARDIIENGFDIYPEGTDKPVHMVAFDKSGNMSRKSRISFIDETYYDALNERLNLGMDFSKIKVQESKYYAYRGLYLSSAKRIEHSNLYITPETLIVLQDERKDPKNPDKSIIGDNYELAEYITAEVNKEASNTNGKTWDLVIKQNKESVFVETPFDGVGFISPQYAKYINESLDVEHATSFQLRLPFAKGMLHQVDVHGFLDEFNQDRSETNKHKYIDAFGIERDLGKAQIFITESMFKGKAWITEYLEQAEDNFKDPMEFYCEMLQKYDHGLYVSGTNLPYGHAKYVHLSYQTINTLNFTEDQFNHILDKHKSFIKKPIEYLNSFDIEESENMDDLDSNEGKIEYHIPNWRHALNKNALLSEDIYIKHELKNTQKGLLTKLATGKILVEGQTRYLCRDLLPLLVSMLENPRRNWFRRYLYYRFYLPVFEKDEIADELGLKYDSYYAFFRNPHLSRNEQYIMRRFCDTDEGTYKGSVDYKTFKWYRELYDKYFGKLTGIVMVPRHSVLPLCLGGADFDGDLVSVVYNQEVVAAVASGVFREVPNEKYGAFYQMHLPVIQIPSTSSETTSIQKHVPYEHIQNTFSNRIGQISNAAISIGQLEYGHELEKNGKQKETSVTKDTTATCEMCTILTGLEIDAAKNGEHPNLDIILGGGIEKCSYISFLHKFKKLRGEAKYTFNNLKVEKIESKENDKEEYIKVTAKDCSTVAKFYPPTFGTFINELPLAFYDAFTYYAKDGKAEEEKKGSKEKKAGKKGLKDNKAEKNQAEIVFTYGDTKKEEEIKIAEFQSKCQNIFEYNFFYATSLMRILRKEKSTGFYAIENLERKLYQAYDEENAVRIQRTVVPSLIAHLKSHINENNTVADIKNRMNEKNWLFVPMEMRAAVLEEIIAGGFSADILDDEEKEVLFNFRNRGYINLWLVLSIIEGPKIKTFDEVLSSNINCNIKVQDKRLEDTLTEYCRACYDNNDSDAVGKIYTTCLKSLTNIIKDSGLSEQNIIAALYELTASSLDNRRFFWDLFEWEKLEKYIM